VDEVVNVSLATDTIGGRVDTVVRRDGLLVARFRAVQGDLVWPAVVEFVEHLVRVEIGAGRKVTVWVDSHEWWTVRSVGPEVVWDGQMTGSEFLTRRTPFGPVAPELERLRNEVVQRRLDCCFGDGLERDYAETGGAEFGPSVSEMTEEECRTELSGGDEPWVVYSEDGRILFEGPEYEFNEFLDGWFAANPGGVELSADEARTLGIDPSVFGMGGWAWVRHASAEEVDDSHLP
jgi:hypothetical protein